MRPRVWAVVELAGEHCANGDTCPRIIITDDGEALVQGDEEADPEVLAVTRPGPGERTVRLRQLQMLVDAGREAERWLAEHAEQQRLDRARLFETFRDSAFRLETLPQYLVEQEAEDFRRFREEQPLPERTPENNEWLRLIAETTAAGRRWQVVHVLSRPLTDYLRYELARYPDNVKAGQEVRIADRAWHPELDDLDEDFWLLDDKLAVRMRYDDQGHFVGSETTEDPTYLARCRQQRDLALAQSVPLETYLATLNTETRPA